MFHISSRFFRLLRICISDWVSRALAPEGRAAQDSFPWACTKTGKAAWGLAALDGVLCRSHADGNGTYTYLHLLNGEKVWSVRVGSVLQMGDSDEDPDGTMPDVSQWRSWTVRAGDGM